MTDSNKRKSGPGDDRSDAKGAKRSKGGSGGKWQTPHQQMKVAARAGVQIEPGDAGIWATCARNQESRAAKELQSMLEECAQRFYGIVSGVGDADGDEAGEGDIEDIEKAIQREISEHKSAPKIFTPIHTDIPCVVFFKTLPSLDPVDFVHRICTEIVSNPGIRKMRYVNRLTPMTLMGRATSSGLEQVARNVLSDHFQLTEREEAANGEDEGTVPISDVSYAIRPTIRAHNNLKRDAVIQETAALISKAHKVNLTTPSKVILVEIYTTVCGMSVVGSDWETLKRYNLAELYHIQPKPPGAAKAEASPQSVTRDEAEETAPAGTSGLTTDDQTAV